MKTLLITKRKWLNFIVFLYWVLCHSNSFAQKKEIWTASEKTYYHTLKAFCGYINQHETDWNLKDSVYKKYVLFDYVLQDTSEKRLQKRLSDMRNLLQGFSHFIDSVGLPNLDAKPVRFYKQDTLVYRPFVNGLEKAEPFSFAYFNKRNAEYPLGYILFDDKTSKVVSWIVINQGGYYYYLTLNLL